jgi:hypothetical protein
LVFRALGLYFNLFGSAGRLMGFFCAVYTALTTASPSA